MKKIKIKYKLNKRGKIILISLLFSLSVVTTVLIVGAIKSGKENDQQTVGTQTDITDEPSITPTETQTTDEKNDTEPVLAVTPTPIIKASKFVMPQDGVRPVAVMIDNESDAVLPQGGIGEAQIVYEVITEYGATRYMTLFWDNLPAMVGPVRSSRHYFLDYVMDYDAIYAHIGWSDYAYRDLAEFEIDNIDGVTREAGGVYWDLTREKNNYHDSYTSAERLNKFISSAGYETKTTQSIPFTYNKDDLDLSGAKAAEEVFIKYSTVSSSGFYYDSSQKNYKRTRLGEFQIDRNTNETVRAKNIIIQFVKNESIAGDKYGRQELYTTGTGNGYYITNGKCEEISWKKDERTQQTKYFNSRGQKLTLNPGQTWIQIVSPNADVRVK
mgnify:FL=1|jgi:hypothetical protein